MLLLKLSDACFIDGPENGEISPETCEFVMQYLFECASDAECHALHEDHKPVIRRKDIIKLPKLVQKDIIASAKKAQAVMATAMQRRHVI